MLSKKELRNIITKSEYTKKEIKKDLLNMSKYSDIVLNVRVYTTYENVFESQILIEVINENGEYIESYYLECITIENVNENEFDFWELKALGEDVLKTKKNAWIKWLQENNFKINNTEDFTC